MSMKDYHINIFYLPQQACRLDHIQHELLGIFDQFFEASQELGGQGSIDQAVIDGEGKGHHWPGYNGALRDDWFFLQASDSENGSFGIVDDRSTGAATEAANIVEGEG